jgi:RNA polymerase sigma-70 factor, ECF subfamily
MPGLETGSGADREERFQAFVVPELEVLLRVALTLSAQPADAEDLVQDTLLRAYRAIGTFDGAYPRAWLLTIMRHTAASRGHRRRPQLLDDPERIGELPPAGPVAELTPEQAVMGRMLDTAVASALATLPDKFQRVVRLVDVDGLSYAETAGLLGVPVGTVMSRLHRARARIRAHLAASGLAPMGRTR